ncbi:MAG: phosphorylase, partial [Bacteroidales bacterium]|nr:phosphorylase [Bacteroidales bacterium]
MNNKPIPSSELIINDDGSVFHLHILPEDLADIVIMMGDPGRVSTIAEHFDTIELDKQSREFHTITGTYRGKRVTALSHG